MKKISAKGKERVITGTCNCGRPLPHLIQRIPDRTMEEKVEKFNQMQIAFGAPPPRRPPTRLKSATILDLRSLGCKLPDYPKTGTKAWQQLLEEERIAKEQKNQKLDALPKIPNLRRKRGSKKLITQDPMLKSKGGSGRTRGNISDAVVEAPEALEED